MSCWIPAYAGMTKGSYFISTVNLLRFCPRIGKYKMQPRKHEIMKTRNNSSNSFFVSFVPTGGFALSSWLRNFLARPAQDGAKWSLDSARDK
jgi:hypothetical protein